MKSAIVHLTTVHPRHDTRIFLKEACSLSHATDAEVYLVVADGKGNEHVRGISVVDIGKPAQGRLHRMVRGAWRAFWTVLAIRPAVVHFHDPELIAVGLLLKLSGARVVYDVHEDVPRQIMSKFWIPLTLRRPVASIASWLEWIGGKVFDAVVTATPTIAARFPSQKAVLVQNFPLLSELTAPEAEPYETRSPTLAYVGGIAEIRGVREMISAVEIAAARQPVTLSIAGSFAPASLEAEVGSMQGWHHVHYVGWATRTEVASLLGGVRAGLVLFHPLPNHMDAQPNKMFEYMAAGLPIIASDFPLWREIVEGAGCGIVVDPMSPTAVADAMCWILDNPEQAAAMGARGRVAVEQIYHWAAEEAKLLELYKGFGFRVGQDDKSSERTAEC